MSVKKDSYAWVWVALVSIAVVATIVLVIVAMTRPKLTLRLGDGVFTASVAATDETRQKGLSGVKELPKDRAMLFVFPLSRTYGIWMKDMKIPIDVVWLDDDRKVIHIVHDMQPDSYPTIYRPKLPARYVIELPAGTAKERSIRVGTVANFDETNMTGIPSW